MPRPSHSRFDHPNIIGWGVHLVTTFEGRTGLSEEICLPS
jgi:hypothetical protein